MQLLWFIPTGGDGRYLATGIGGRTTDFPYLEQIAKAVDHLGYFGALLPVGRYCEDPWVVASTLIPITRQMRFLVALRPGLMSPGVAARMAATFDRLSNGRLLLNVVTGGDPLELAGDGLHLNHDDRYQLTQEFLTVWRQVTAGETTHFKGDYLDIRDGKLMFPPRQTPHPPLWFGGSSAVAQRIAAQHVDTYLTWGEPPAQAAEKIAAVRELAEAEGRSLKFGMRLHVIVRETDAEAWEAAEQLIRYVDEDAIATAQAALAKNDSVGQQRMVNLHQGNRNALEISPNLWAGVGLVRSGAGTALVGSPDTVAARLLEYQAIGIDTFILSGYPHLEEAFRVAELLFPRLPLTHDLLTPPSQSASPRGEIVGNFAFPKQPSEPKPQTQVQLSVD